MPEMNDAKQYHTATGFTLIEILIAIFLFSLVVTIVFASFHQISVSAGIIGKSGDAMKMAHSCIDRMTSDLEAIYIKQKPGYVKPEFDSKPDPYRVEGGTDMTETIVFPKIRFTSRNHLPIDRDMREGIAEIVYYVRGTEEGGFVLKRSDRISFEEDFEATGKDPVLCKNLKSMTVNYIDEEGDEHDDWDSESDEFGYATPSAVNIRFEIDEDGYAIPFETRISLRSVRKKAEE